MRTDSPWEIEDSGGYLKTTGLNGYNVLINGVNRYLNFNTLSGALGYGFRDNSGTLQFKNSGGSWADITSGLSSVSWSDLTGTPTALLLDQTFPQTFSGVLGGTGLVKVNSGVVALDGSNYTVYGSGLSQFNNDSGYITDAPADNSLYARKNNSWDVVSGGGGGAGSGEIEDFGDRVSGSEVHDLGLRI